MVNKSNIKEQQVNEGINGLDIIAIIMLVIIPILMIVGIIFDDYKY
jgi:hypothetical protein